MRVLELWRVRRAPALGDLADRLSAGIERPAIDKGSLDRMHARFLEIARARDPLDVPRLLTALANGRSPQLAARVEALAAFPDDPRIALGLADVFATPLVADGPTLALVRDVLVRTADARVLARLAPHAARPEVAALRRELERIVEACPDVPRDELAAIVARVSDPAAELLAAIYAAPDDDGPREVYADWLLENGDAERGEFIALQLRRARTGEGPTPRELALLADGRRWAGPLAKLALVTGYRRGFPDSCAANTKNPRAFVSKLSEPAWSTVRSLCLDRFDAVPPAMLQMPNFRRLERLEGVTLAFAEVAVRARPSHDLVELDVRERAVMPSPAELGQALGGEWSGLPRLRRLSLSFPRLLSPEHVAALAAGPASRRLEALDLRGEELIEAPSSLTAWLDPLTPTSVTRLTLFAGGVLERVREPGSKAWRSA